MNSPAAVAPASAAAPRHRPSLSAQPADLDQQGRPPTQSLLPGSRHYWTSSRSGAWGPFRPATHQRTGNPGLARLNAPDASDAENSRCAKPRSQWVAAGSTSTCRARVACPIAKRSRHDLSTVGLAG